jgi:iron complex transport system substrate-binding protein
MKRTSFRLSLRLMVLVLVLTLSLAACGQDDVATQSEPQPEPKKEETVTSENTEAKSNSERVVQHAMGETKVPSNPKRIVVLDNGALDNLLALGIKPIGATTVTLEDPFFSYLADQTDGIENVGTIDQPNLESVASMKPDLILGSKDTHEAIYDKLSQIAPTVFTETLGLDWRTNLRIQAEAVGKSEEAKTLISDYEQRVEEFKAEMGDKLANTQVSILRPRGDHIRIYLSESFSGKIIENIGLPRPPAQSEAEFAKKVTEEQIADLDGDVIFWFSRDPENMLKTKLMSSPLWSDLKAVKANKVYEVSAETWLSGMGVQSVNLILDDLFTYLVK